MQHLFPRTGVVPSASPYFPIGADCAFYHDYGDGLESADDHSLNTNHGTVIGAQFGTVAGVKCLIFDGVDNQVRLADHASLNFGTGPITIFAWFYRDDAMGDNVLYSLGGQTPSWLSVVFGSNAGLGTNKEASINAYDGAYEYRSYPERYPGTPTAEMETAAWQFIAFCIDRPNGSKVYSSPYPTYSTLKGSTNITNYQFADGGLLNGIAVGRATNALWGAKWWKGGIGQILQFNAIKTETEVTEFFDFTKGRYPV